MRTEVTPRDREICEALSPLLRQDGLYFVGLDVIGNYLTEVNVTSPTGYSGNQLAERRAARGPGALISSNRKFRIEIRDRDLLSEDKARDTNLTPPTF